MGGDEGLRARKRRETGARIARAALTLFQKQGYDATTLEAVAAAADVSPRTLYHYFASKDELLRHWNGSGGFLVALGPAIVASGTALDPLATVRAAMRDLIPQFETRQSVEVARIFAATESLRAGKQAFFFDMERIVYDALRESWPQPDRMIELRAVAMAGAGVLRIARELQLGDAKPLMLVDYIERIFAAVADGVLFRPAA